MNDETTKERVTRLKQEGKTFTEIGQIIGLSRQRAHQIYNGIRSYKDRAPEPEDLHDILLNGLRKQITK